MNEHVLICISSGFEVISIKPKILKNIFNSLIFLTANVTDSHWSLFLLAIAFVSNQHCCLKEAVGSYAKCGKEQGTLSSQDGGQTSKTDAGTRRQKMIVVRLKAIAGRGTELRPLWSLLSLRTSVLHKKQILRCYFIILRCCDHMGLQCVMGVSAWVKHPVSPTLLLKMSKAVFSDHF